MLPPRPAPEHLAMASLSASGGSCSWSYPCAGSYICIDKIVRGIPVVTSILRPFIGASSSSSSASTPDLDSSDDYPEIEAAFTRNPRKAVALSAWHLQQISHHREIKDVRRPNTERRLGPEFEFRLQCCPGPDDYGDHPAHGARWPSPCCPISARGCGGKPCRRIEVDWCSSEGTFSRQ
jgi:hypothetical protein